MKTIRRLIFFPLAAFLTIAMGNPLFAQTNDALKACLQDVAEQDLASKKEFQGALADLVIREYPQYAELAGLNRDLQTALAEARALRLSFLIETETSRFLKASSLTRFTNFDWTGTEEDALAGQNPAYAALMERIETMTVENEAHQDWPALRSSFGALQGSKEFQQILGSLMEDQKKNESKLGAC